MRSISIICILVVFCGMSMAQEQIKQNVYSLGGTISYSSSTTNTNNSEYDQGSYGIAPSISYFIVNQCELSVNIGYVRSTMKQTNPSFEYKITSLALGLGIRFYLPAGKIAPFIGASGGTSWTSYDSQSFSTPKTNYSLSGGLEIFISQSAAIEPAISYSKNRVNEQYSISGFQISIGAKYFIL